MGERSRAVQPTTPVADDCPICLRGQPMDVLVELPATWATAASDAPLPGYVCVVSKVHVREPFELTGDTRRAWWDDVSRVAAAVASATSAAKLNYEIHGNTIPHLHLHLYPRYPGDPFEGGPIDTARRPWFHRSRGDLDRLRDAIADT
jgi:diadenosine tetraphosphate (Ap4A) HIT family hydrolase